MNLRMWAAAIVASAAIALAPAASATSTCVSDTAGLRAAMDTWQTDTGTTPTVIKLVRNANPYVYLYYDYWSQVYYGGNAPLQLLGGYAPGCAASGRVLDATNTVLDGQQATHDSGFELQGASSILIEGISFKSFRRNVEIDDESSSPTDSVVVRNVIGHDLFGAASTQQRFGGFRVAASTNVRVESSLFYNIHGGDSASALEVTGFGDNFIAFVTNITAAYNGTHGMSLACFQCSGAVFAYSNILYNNTLGDLDTRLSDPGSGVLIAYSDFNTSTGVYSSSGNINVDPHFENPLNDDFLLLADSQAINAGALEWQVIGGYSSQDLAGGTRVIGSRVDLGAFESATNDQAPQMVNATTDNLLDATLRVAINTANSNPNATAINFNLGNALSCPQVIDLSAPLPDITTDVTINGFSEPGSKINTLFDAYDGKICLILRANGTITHALQVSGAGRLTVKGIEFEGFTVAGVRLAAGNGSFVAGNSFSTFPGAVANDTGVRIEGSANHSLIGSLTAGDRNVFNQGSYGVDFEANGTGANTVEGNYFGYDFDGTPRVGSQPFSAIYLANSSGNTLRNNYVGGVKNEGILLSGASTTGNVLSQNIIGEAPTLAAAGNGSAGIGIVNGAHANVIGTATFLTQSGGGNRIVYNSGPGIWVENGAGSGNRIDGNNVIHDNSGLLAIDLGAASDIFGLGLTANDANDSDSGPNKLENYPYLTQAMRFEANKIALDGYILPEFLGSSQTYRLDLFWTDTCVGTGAVTTQRGEMKRYVGYFFLTVSASASFKAFPYTTITAPASIPGTGYLFATATDGTGNTSEPGACFPFTDDYIFTNSFGS